MLKSQLPSRSVLAPETVSEGGMSEAFVCRDTHLDRFVIIKALAPGTDPGRLLDELSALQEIRSKHVVQIYDVIRDTSGAIEAIVEEFLPGKDLESLPPADTADAFIRRIYPIAEGIADIHEHERVHRDIKPNNMKYDSENILKLFDFGLSRIDGLDAATLNVIGTRGYMAPELFAKTSGGRVRFTKAVDVFAFGSTAFRIATGQLPYDLMAIPPRLPCPEIDFTKLPFTLPSNITDILLDCFARDPEVRPTMRGISDLLAMHLLRDRHRALIVLAGATHFLSADNRVAVISASSASLRITYDGFRFRVSAVTGDVAINNQAVGDGYEIRGSCVIVLGSPALGRRRTSVTVDVAHPEVAL
jgi:eukaryotic-like serine/threonine-protein kinase